MKVSFIIVTIGRPKKLLLCISSIINSCDPENYEVVLIDQSVDETIKKLVGDLHHKNPEVILSYLKNKSTGLSSGRNLGISGAKGEILCFLDDDCIISKSYWTEINRIELKNLYQKGIVLIFGRTIAYQPKLHRTEFCPSVFDKHKSEIFKSVKIHWDNWGNGNNMVAFGNYVRDAGGFIPWLGVGAAGQSAEDVEYALRALNLGKKIYFDHRLLVYHNKWMDKRNFRNLSVRYACGPISVYGAYALTGLPGSTRAFYQSLIDSFRLAREDLKKILFKKGQAVLHLSFLVRQLLNTVKGIFLIGRLYVEIKNNGSLPV